MTKKEEPQEEENLDKVLDNIDLSEKTELGEVADSIFEAGTTKTNLSGDEIALTFITGIQFKALKMEKHDPTKRFMQLKKSQGGWSTEKFVQATSGVNDQRAGGSMGSWMKERLFTPKQ